MPKSSFVDFRAVKAAITMEQVLDRHYGLLDHVQAERKTASARSLSHPQRLKPDAVPGEHEQEHLELFQRVQARGQHPRLHLPDGEKVSISHAAATKAIEWFKLDREAMSSSSRQEEEQEGETEAHADAPWPKPAPKKPAATPENSAPNKPLNFRLDKLERDHPYLTERGLSLETTVDFGIGFCTKGTMAAPHRHPHP